MIATQLYPAPTFAENRDRDSAQYLPANDIESFKKLLPPEIDFVEGSSSGTLSIGDAKYQPINGSPTQLRKNDQKVSETRSYQPSQSESSSTKPVSSEPAKSLWTRPIDTTWPANVNMGCGLNNTGNTCFLNSALQCLIHTPPLYRVLSTHSLSDPCYVKKHAFCMSCSMWKLMRECFERKIPTTPYPISSKLSEIAKHMRKGRQEDSHEFLRYAIDALQKSCLAANPKIDHKLAVTTWVHKIFGGKLRSRVTCLSCGYNSDTYDDMLDLSVDIFGADSLQKALRKFVAIDHLKGADKYKCDKCKKHVSADKSFTIHEAPVVLSIHLKRFTPMGRKMNQPIRYDEQLSLQSVMSEGQYGPTYDLYGVISHAGGGPNSGHYYSHIKNAHGQWYEMNDESVTRVSNPPTNMRNAYVLFYLRRKGQALEAALSAPTSTPKQRVPSPAVPKPGLVAGMKKRKVTEDMSKPFIGPLLPSPSLLDRASPPDAKKQKPNPPDPQAKLLQKKIAAASQSRTPVKSGPPNALESLSQYKDDDEDSDIGEKVEKDVEMAGTVSKDKHPSTLVEPLEDPSRSPVSTSPTLTEPSLPPTSASTSITASSSSVGVSGPVPATSFYSSEGSKLKGKHCNTVDLTSWAKTPISPPSRPKSYASQNPYNRLIRSDNLRQPRDGNSGTHSSAKRRGRSVAV
ncbi:cysteine proteinase [Cristinia sonorae]|uniref:Ubiquitin carboxyl-terminal hydrolase n=1 Tax=Cristinia sonorae TaxID=1940300 RepID=A0A8K0UKJ3_9AGAR|nr:cysteine proteinase [Cristinia sonorae]